MLILRIRKFSIHPMSSPKTSAGKTPCQLRMHTSIHQAFRNSLIEFLCHQLWLYCSIRYLIILTIRSSDQTLPTLEKVCGPPGSAARLEVDKFKSLITNQASRTKEVGSQSLKQRLMTPYPDPATDISSPRFVFLCVRFHCNCFHLEICYPYPF